MFSKKNFNIRFVQMTLAIIASMIAVAGFVYGATTIGTNISVDGNLTVSGASATSTFSTGGVTVGTNKFVVQQTSGNVGIGTTSPWGLLSVNPNALAAGTPQFVVGSSTQTSFVIANNGNVYIGTTTPPPITFARVFINNATQYDAGLVIQDNRSTGGSAALTLSQDWDNGLGTQMYYVASGASGANLLVLPRSVVWQGDQGGIVLQVNAGPILFATGGFALSNERMRINATGNVGIGTTTPYSRFHVSQGASATTTVNFGEVGSATSKACFNTKNVSGADISFYFSAANALVVESNLCR